MSHAWTISTLPGLCCSAKRTTTLNCSASHCIAPHIDRRPPPPHAKRRKLPDGGCDMGACDRQSHGPGCISVYAQHAISEQGRNHRECSVTGNETKKPRARSKSATIPDNNAHNTVVSAASELRSVNIHTSLALL